MKPGLYIVRKRGNRDETCDLLWYWQERTGWYYVLGAGMKTKVTESVEEWLKDFEILETVMEESKSMSFFSTELTIKTMYRGKNRDDRGNPIEYQFRYPMRNMQLFLTLMSRLPGIGHSLGDQIKPGKRR